MWRRMFPAEHFVECFYSTASIDSELESSQEYPKNFFFFSLQIVLRWSTKTDPGPLSDRHNPGHSY